MRRTWVAAALAGLLFAACAGTKSATEQSAPPVTDAATTTSGAQAATTSSTAVPIATTTPATTTIPATTTTVTPAAPPEPLTVQQLLDLGRPIVLAHAAGEDQFPHSSPYGFAASAAAGVDMLDFDVMLTADDVLVVQHDESTGRTANEDLVVAETTYEQLHALDNAYWFSAEGTKTGEPDSAYIYRGIRTQDKAPPAGASPDDFAIARFGDLLDRFPSFPVNIEIKGEGEQGAKIAAALAEVLTDHDLLDNAVVAAFDDTVVSAFQAIAPSVEVTPGLGAASAFILGDTPLPDGMRILQVPVMFQDIVVLSPENIAKSHAAGYVIWVWPNDRAWENPKGYRDLLELGLDGLNINYPADGVAAVRALSTTG